MGNCLRHSRSEAIRLGAPPSLERSLGVSHGFESILDLRHVCLYVHVSTIDISVTRSTPDRNQNRTRTPNKNQEPGTRNLELLEQLPRPRRFLERCTLQILALPTHALDVLLIDQPTEVDVDVQARALHSGQQ